MAPVPLFLSPFEYLGIIGSVQVLVIVGVVVGATVTEKDYDSNDPEEKVGEGHGTDCKRRRARHEHLLPQVDCRVHEANSAVSYLCESNH